MSLLSRGRADLCLLRCTRTARSAAGTFLVDKGVGSARPEESEYVPGPAGLQVIAPGSSWYSPGPHGVSSVAPDSITKLPGWANSQDVASDCDWNEPG